VGEKKKNIKNRDKVLRRTYKVSVLGAQKGCFLGLTSAPSQTKNKKTGQKYTVPMKNNTKSIPQVRRKDPPAVHPKRVSRGGEENLKGPALKAQRNCEWGKKI